MIEIEMKEAGDSPTLGEFEIGDTFEVDESFANKIIERGYANEKSLLEEVIEEVEELSEQLTEEENED